MYKFLTRHFTSGAIAWPLIAIFNVYGLMSVLATVAGKSFNGKFGKNWFSDRVFYVTIADDDIGSLKSLHTLFW